MCIVLMCCCNGKLLTYVSAKTMAIVYFILFYSIAFEGFISSTIAAKKKM